MNIIKYVTIGLLFIGMTTLVGCSKEDKINKNLWKNGGEWNVEEYKNNWLFSGSTSNSETLYDFGTFTFEKDGTGKRVIMDGGQTYTNLFTYTNTATELVITYKEGPIASAGYREKYTMTWEKDKIELYAYLTSEDLIYDEYFITLKKK